MPQYVCANGDCENGVGLLLINDLLLYKGEFRDGQPNGLGTSYFENGKIHYKGKWRNGLFDGRGTDHWDNGKIEYEGEWRDGKPDGEGTFYDADGNAVYEGQWINGRPDGIENEDRSSEISGAVNHDHRLKRRYTCEGGNCTDGGGTLRLEEAILYAGEWRDGKPDGQGTSNYPNGTVQFIGEWREGVAHGRGTRYFDDGEYVGEFRQGFAHGKGSIYAKNGNVLFEGNFAKGKPNGEGIQYLDGVSGKSRLLLYEGEWLDGNPHGTGTVYRFSAEIEKTIVLYDGEWSDGKAQGFGNLYSDVYESFDETDYNYGSRANRSSEHDSFILYQGEWVQGRPNGRGKSYHVASVSDRYDTYSPLGDAIESVVTGRHVNSGGYERSFRKHFGGLEHISYDGQWRDGLRHGQGVSYYDCRSELLKRVVDGIKSYEGQWSNGDRSGQGISYRVVNAKNRKVKVSYQGQWRVGRPGECLKGDCESGYGIFRFLNGKERYEGEWQNRRQFGQGRHFWASGKVAYEGEFRDGDPNGVGILHWPDGKIAYSGDFRHGTPVNGERVSKDTWHVGNTRRIINYQNRRFVMDFYRNGRFSHREM